MRHPRKLFLLLLFVPLALSAQSKALPGFAVVELFTSEGCSSCPPADEALSQLVRRADREKLPMYALEWHVDYWDYLGWKDPWDSRLATERQDSYARTLPHRSTLLRRSSTGTPCPGTRATSVSSNRTPVLRPPHPPRTR